MILQRAASSLPFRFSSAKIGISSSPLRQAAKPPCPAPSAILLVAGETGATGHLSRPGASAEDCGGGMQDGKWAPLEYPQTDKRGSLVWIWVAPRKAEIGRQNFLGLKWPEDQWRGVDGEGRDRTFRFHLAEGLCSSVVCI